MPAATTIALCSHLLLEIPAAVNFILRPSATLSSPQPGAHAVIRQYGLLLAVSNILIVMILQRGSDIRFLHHVNDLFHHPPEKRLPDDFVRDCCWVLSLYHGGPILRALARIGNGQRRGVMGGPLLYLVLHVSCGAWLMIAGYGYW